ncbi:hypothetical protein [Clostridium sp.]|uniref:hypothetical protein n=1 Tax=Clostridium sp. TaxID=1506 RepID=UPI00284868BD|nr:hypothetical protein [Clostridium sp.]MDR3598532.1 hypothetical protein [Clostridium sp.]
MNNNVNIILEEMKILPRLQACKRSIVILANNAVNLSVEDFDKAAEYIWENNIVKILKVEHERRYIIKLYADVSEI